MGARVNLYEEEIEQLVQDRGHWCDWERAAVCHCITKDSGQPNFMCPTCGGSGYRYLPAQRIKVAVTSLNSQWDLETLELREPGTAYVTPTKEVIMGYKDRLRFPDFRCIFSEVIHWNFSEDGRGISPKTYRNIREVLFLADDEYEYEMGVDFEVTEDTYHLRCINKKLLKSLDHKNMSLLYYTTPSYLVVDLLHELRATLSNRKSGGEDTFRELPKQYKVQREDFIYNIADAKPVQDSEETAESGTQETQPEETSSNNTFTYDDDGGITI
jgi:hypothetical protein